MPFTKPANEALPPVFTILKSLEKNQDKDVFFELARLYDYGCWVRQNISEAIKYYKLERELLIKLGKPVPEIVERSIAVLEDYQYKVLVEGKYYKLEW